MKKLNILDIHRNISQKHAKRTECYEKVLELCHKKILANSENKKYRLFYEVPDFLLGYPVFDINDCIKYVLDNLNSNGFLAIYYFPRYLYISWDLEEIEKHKQQQKKNSNIQEMKNVLDFKYKSTGKLSLDI